MNFFHKRNSQPQPSVAQGTGTALKSKATGPNIEKMTHQEMLQVLRRWCQASNGNAPATRDELGPVAIAIGKELRHRGGRSEVVRMFEALDGMAGSDTLELIWQEHHLW